MGSFQNGMFVGVLFGIGLGVTLALMIWAPQVLNGSSGESPTAVSYPVSGPNTTLIVNETGLPAGTTWSVRLACLGAGDFCTSENVTGIDSVLKLNAPADAVYTYTIVVPKPFSASPDNGTISGSYVVVVHTTVTNLTVVAEAQLQAQRSQERADQSAFEILLGGVGTVFVWLVPGRYMYGRFEAPYEVDGEVVSLHGDADTDSQRLSSGSFASHSFGILRGQVPTPYENDPDLCEPDVILPWERRWPWERAS